MYRIFDVAGCGGAEKQEAVMRLPASQARDAWLLFMQISRTAVLEGTKERAFAAYVERAPKEALRELANLIGLLSPFLPVFALVPKMVLGKILTVFSGRPCF